MCYWNKYGSQTFFRFQSILVNVFQVHNLSRIPKTIYLGFLPFYNYLGKSVFWRNNVLYFLGYLMVCWFIHVEGGRRGRPGCLFLRAPLLWFAVGRVCASVGGNVFYQVATSFEALVPTLTSLCFRPPEVISLALELN